MRCTNWKKEFETSEGLGKGITWTLFKAYFRVNIVIYISHKNISVASYKSRIFLHFTARTCYLLTRITNRLIWFYGFL